MTGFTVLHRGRAALGGAAGAAERAGGGTFLDPVLSPVERIIYKVIGVDPKREHTWKQYLVAMLIFSLVIVGIVFLDGF